MTLAVLVVTYLESSPAGGGRMAKSLPSANLGMVAFIGRISIRLSGGRPGMGDRLRIRPGRALTLFVVAGELGADARDRQPGRRDGVVRLKFRLTVEAAAPHGLARRQP